MNRVDIISEDASEAGFVDRLCAYVELILRILGKDNWDVSILLCGDQNIRELNARYRGLDEATDVLSFSDGGSFVDSQCGTRFVAGDIVISMDTLRKNADYFNVEVDEELRRLIVHGLLHLDGMDHEDNDPDRPMLRRQEEIVRETRKERIIV